MRRSIRTTQWSTWTLHVSLTIVALFLHLHLVQAHLEHLEPISAGDCARCICENRGACENKTCTATTNSATYSGSSGLECGPFALSVETWRSWSRKKPPGVIEGSSEETAAFINCSNDFTCAQQTFIAYSANGSNPKDCNGDGEFTCEDMYWVQILGLDNCDSRLSKNPHLVKGAKKVNSCWLATLADPDKTPGPVKNNGANVPPPPAEKKSQVGLIVGAGAGVLIFLVLVTIVWCWRCYRKKTESGTAVEAGSGTKTKLEDKDKSLELSIPLNCIIPPDELTIDRNKLLGEGQYGKVYEGNYNGARVAVKEAKYSGAVDPGQVRREMEVLAKLGKHRNIIRFYGTEVSQISKGTAYIVLELCPYGSLLDFVRTLSRSKQRDLNARPDYVSIALSLENEDAIMQVMTNWTQQIVTGMEFLEYNNTIHGDLAARNILLFGKQVKISDFGFARNLGHYDSFRKDDGPLPWRWLAPESINRHIFSSKSDVWAFGVTIWEVFTLGRIPYTGVEKCSSQFLKDLENGMRLKKPESIPDEMYDTLQQCWKFEPDARPTFFQLKRLVADVEKVVCISSSSMNNSEYEEVISTVPDSKVSEDTFTDSYSYCRVSEECSVFSN